MAFTTGVASGPDDLLSQLVTFAVANAGFTNQGSVSSSAGTGSRTIQRLSKGGVWYQFFRATDSKSIAGFMGYSGVPSLWVIPGAGSLGAGFQLYYTEMNTWQYTGPYVGHYFFTEGTCVHAVVEIASGIYNHFSFGKVTQNGTWTGGEYITTGYCNVLATATDYRDMFDSYATRPFNAGADSNAGARGSYLRIANAASVNDFAKAGGNSAAITNVNLVHFFVGRSSTTGLSAADVYANILRDAPNASTHRTPLLPGTLRARLSTADTLWNRHGRIPGVAFLQFAPDMNPKDIINTDWQVFPVSQRAGGNPTLASLSFQYALAYKRVA